MSSNNVVSIYDDEGWSGKLDFFFWVFCSKDQTVLWQELVSLFTTII